MWNASAGDAEKDDEDELLTSVLPITPFLITNTFELLRRRVLLAV